MEALDRLIAGIERDLDAERCAAALPEMIALAKEDPSRLSRVYLLGARCFFVARDFERYRDMLEEARKCAGQAGLEAQIRVQVIEASLLNSAGDFATSNKILQSTLQNADAVSSELRALMLSCQGRNEALVGRYSQAIELSQEAIAFGEELSSSSAFANGTISFVFGMMGRMEESEQYGLEQIRIMMERGSGNWVAGLYAALSTNAAAVQRWDKAQEYALKAEEHRRGSTGQQSNPTLSLLWKAASQLGMEHHAEALETCKEALRVALNENNLSFTVSAHLVLGRAHFANGNYAEALAALQIPLDNLSLLSDNLTVELYKWLANTYKALDRKAEAFDICYLLWELQTDFDNRTREALLSYHRELEQKVSAQKISIMNLKSAQLERELALTATQLVAQTDLLGRFRNDLREIVRESRSDDPAMRKVKEKLKSLPCEQIDWNRFETQFSTVHPEFKLKLESKHPDLTRSEIKICALSRMKLTSEEIGRLLCLSERTVQAHRFNIRKKTSLTKDQSLAEYLGAL